MRSDLLISYLVSLVFCMHGLPPMLICCNRVRPGIQGDVGGERQRLEPF